MKHVSSYTLNLLLLLSGSEIRNVMIQIMNKGDLLCSVGNKNQITKFSTPQLRMCLYLCNSGMNTEQ